MTKYIHIPTGDEVELEAWRWEAYYLDGSVIKQFDKLDEEHGEFHRFAEIDQARLHLFKMVSDNPGYHFTLLFDPRTMKLVHFYKNSIKAVEAIGDDGHIKTIGEPLTSRGYVFGYESGGQKHFLFISPSGEIVMTDDPDKVALTIATKEIE